MNTHTPTVMPKHRGILALLKAAFTAGFAVGRISKSWGRLSSQLARLQVRGAWRTRPAAPRRRGNAKPPLVPGWAVLVGVLFLALTLVLDLGQHLPAQLFIAKTENEARELRNKIIATGDALLGRPYVYGAAGPDSFDCSGFVVHVFRESFGYSFGSYGVRTSAQMAASSGESVSRANLQPGDLVFFATDDSRPTTVTHVAIFVAPDRILHANSYTNTVTYDRFASSMYFDSKYLSARRIVKADGAYVPPTTPPPPPAPEPFQELPPSDETRPADGTVTLATSSPFPDVVSTHPYAPAIALLKERNIIGGYPDGTFQPKRTVSRVELLKFAFNAFNVGVSVQDPPFGDIPAGHWGRGFIATAHANGWVSGPGDGNFYPDNTVTRAEAAKILFNVGRLSHDIPTRKPLYADVPRDNWAAPYAAEIKESNLLDSFGVNFEPNMGMNRESVAEFVVRVLRSQGKA